MRKISFVLLFITLMCISGCGSENPTPEDSHSVSGDMVSSEEKNDTEVIFKTESSEESTVQTETSEAEESVTCSPEKNETVSSDQTAEESKNNQVKDSVSDTSGSNTTGTEAVETKPDESEQSEPDETNSPEISSAVPNAVSADAKEIATLVAVYINEYRNEQGIASATILPGLTKYAEYRSVQIISDFSHNTLDERSAATAMSYGKYIDPSLYGMSGDPYYTACAGEAIAKAGYIGSVEYVSKSLAKLIRNSPEHWCYIGAADYQFIGVGITYESGMWYCDVALTRENFG